MNEKEPAHGIAAPWRPGSWAGLLAPGRAGGWHRLTSGGRWNAAIVLLALSFIGAIWIVTVERIGYERNETLESVTVQNSNLAIALEEHAVRTFKSASQALAQVARGHPGSGGLHDIADLVRVGAIDHSIFTVIGVADESGRPLHDSLLSRSSADFTGLDFFESHRADDTGKLFVGKPLLGPISGEWAIPVSRRINKPDGSFGGVAFAGIHPHYFTEFYRQTHLGVNGVMMLVGLDGIIRARQSWGTLGTFGQDLTGSTLLAEQGKAKSGSYLSRGRGRIEAGRRYYSYRTLAQFPFVVAVGKGEPEVLEAFWERRRLYFAGSGAATLLIVIIAGILMLAMARQRGAEEASRLSAKAFESIADGIIVTDANRRIVYANSAFTHITGYSQEDIIGKTPRFLQSGRHDAAFYAALWAEIERSGHWHGEVWDRRKSGGIYPALLSISAVRDGAARITHYVGVSTEISSLKEFEAQLRHQASHDALTGLANRSLLQDRFRETLSRARRHGHRAAVLFLDLDHFKDINDSLGHDSGDLLLQAVGERLQAQIREIDTVARFGGDEFAVLLDAIDDNQDAGVVARKLIEALAPPFKIKDRQYYISASIGIGCYPQDGSDVDTLLKNADTAMYRAKAEGRNNHQFFSVEMNAQALEKLQMGSSLRLALEQKEFLLHYQPRLDLATGRITGAEALIRWRHPELGMIAPARFIPIAEENGLIEPIGEWVLRTACRQMRAWRDAELPLDRMAVNLSARQFSHPDLLQRIAAILGESGLPARDLEVEVTESMVMRNPEATAGVLSKLKALGIAVSIDDFGTGYSSLSYLKRFPIDYLKIDQSFVRGIPSDADDAAIIAAIIAMARSLKLKLIAEGVETAAQRDFLRSHGCDEAQGYLFARPVSASELERLVNEQAGKAWPAVA